ncbi:hypothetical protein LZ30DRAFT_428163 [Colletotrichum cereale]|nr:hypothetical protein LZ30DRAFT_428163 [Colletotrichum cereale]
MSSYRRLDGEPGTVQGPRLSYSLFDQRPGVACGAAEGEHRNALAADASRVLLALGVLSQRVDCTVMRLLWSECTGSEKKKNRNSTSLVMLLVRWTDLYDEVGCCDGVERIAPREETWRPCLGRVGWSKQRKVLVQSEGDDGERSSRAEVPSMGSRLRTSGR